MLLIRRRAIHKMNCTDREVIMGTHVPLCCTLPVQLVSPLVALFASATVIVAKRKVVLSIRAEQTFEI